LVPKSLYPTVQTVALRLAIFFKGKKGFSTISLGLNLPLHGLTSTTSKVYSVVFTTILTKISRKIKQDEKSSTGFAYQPPSKLGRSH
jgi:hypothetical protein